jgi:murein DD-endopeptidase MepM/ murein hydrolase activator NlpD
VKIPQGANITGILVDQGLSRDQALQVIDAARPIHNLARLRAGEFLWFRGDLPGEQVSSLSYPIDRYAERKLVVEREGDGWVGRLVQQPVAHHLVTREGVVESSLWGSFEDAGLRAEDIVAFARIFEWEVDFNTMVQKGDRWRVAIDDLRDTRSGEHVRYGPIHAAEWWSSGVPLRAFRYEDDDEKVGYFDAEGCATRQMFLKSPLEFSRITSGFSTSRYHPVLKTWRAHRGIDYGAAEGTPVRAVGHGRVSFAGEKSGYGKHVRVEHTSQFGSSYSHLSRIAVRQGAGVSQGEIIGYVGHTGLATGPHLHFEFYVGGDYRNFLAQVFPRSEPLADHELPAFYAARDAVLPLLAPPVQTEAPAEDAPILHSGG